jgi:hypothetical protein
MPHSTNPPAAVSPEFPSRIDRTADEKVRLLDALVRAVDFETGGRLVASALEDELVWPTGGPLPRKAAELASELRLTGAIPALVHCLEQLRDDDDPLACAARDALRSMGPAPVDPLLEAFERWTSPELRLRFAGALLDTRVRNDRIFNALVQLLEDDPCVGPEYLAEYADRDALPVLSQALDRAVLEHLEPFDIFTNEDVCVLAAQISKLGGVISASQQAKLDEVRRRREAAWAQWNAAHPRPTPATRRVTRGRNAPCHCGSGRKYKKCHLDEDARRGCR